ncbi:MAG: NAD(P)-binding protein [Phormidesmis sp. RL_2_1]|nr:NAD(P)-binding protein [Phormidesmis sp. RL_2_1]
MVFCTVNIGAEPASLIAAYELVKHDQSVIVLTPDAQVGGYARTETYRAYPLDIAAQPFRAESADIKALCQEILDASWVPGAGDRMISATMRSRIYYRYRLFDYPLSLTNALKHLGPIDTVLTALSYFHAQSQFQTGHARGNSNAEANTLEDWLTMRFGRHLYRIFFDPYLKKTWGISGHELHAEWATHKIEGLSLFTAVASALVGSSNVPILQQRSCDYPKLGPSMLWGKCQKLIEQAKSSVKTNAQVVRVEHTGHRIARVVIQQDDKTIAINADDFIVGLPVAAFVKSLNPPAPPAIRKIAESLKHRARIVVPVIVKVQSEGLKSWGLESWGLEAWPDRCIHVPSSEFQVSRIHHYQNWRVATAENKSQICLGMEYLCNEGDAIWCMDKATLMRMAQQELADMRLVTDAGLVSQSADDCPIIWQANAYPIYDTAYVRHLSILQDYLKGFENLQMVGRHGLHRDMSIEGAMRSGLTAADHILNQRCINVERRVEEKNSVLQLSF